jgi:hypothetical protein
MPMSEAARKAAGDRMRAMHAKKKLSEGTQETAKEIITQFKENTLPYQKPLALSIIVDVDWEHVPMLAGQQAYATLRAEFEKAGKILNARSLKTDLGFQCFMCHGDFDGMPAFRDDSYKDEKTGLLVPVRICGQMCLERYNLMCFERRRDANQRRENETRK